MTFTAKHCLIKLYNVSISLIIDTLNEDVKIIAIGISEDEVYISYYHWYIAWRILHQL